MKLYNLDLKISVECGLLESAFPSQISQRRYYLAIPSLFAEIYRNMRTKLVFLILFGLGLISHSFSQTAIFPASGTLYDNVLHEIRIVIPPDSLADLLKPENRWTNHKYPANLVYDGKDTLVNVGIRIRGNTSRNAKRLAFRIDLDEFAEQNFQGIKTFHLKGEHNDPSLLRQWICSQVLLRAGIPGYRVNPVKVYFNSVYQGLYMQVEHVGKTFLDSRLGNKKGNLFKCTWPADLDYLGTNQTAYKAIINPSPLNERAYELQTNESADDYSMLVNLIQVVNSTPSAELEQKLNQVFEVDAYLNLLAAEVLLGHWDNYFFNKNNYYLYFHSETGKAHYFSYDLDNTLGVEWSVPDIGSRDINNWGNLSWSKSPLTYKILSVPAFKDSYNRKIKWLCEEVFNESLFPMIDSMKAQISSAVQTDPFYAGQRESDYGFDFADWNQSFTGSLGGHVKNGIKPYITQRKNSALAQVKLSTGSYENFGYKSPIFINPIADGILRYEIFEAPVRIRLYSLTMEFLMEWELASSGTGVLHLNHLASGVYFLEYKHGDDSVRLLRMVVGS